MSSKGKGKDVAGGKGSASSGKRKRNDDNGKAGRRKDNPVLQFFEDAAAESGGDDDDDDDLFSDFDDFNADFVNDFINDPEERNEPVNVQQAPLFPKEEDLSGDELERAIEERYKSGSGYVRYSDDGFETKRLNRDFVAPQTDEAAIWKVKCKVSREKQTVFCLMQKYVNLKLLGTKFPLISVFYVEHVKGFVFVEAYKQFEVMEACRQLPDVYYSMISQVPKNEISHLLSLRKKQAEVTKGMWARFKSGKYKGDLSKVVSVNNSKGAATVKVIPRVDFQALAMKYGGGSSSKSAAIPPPAPRLLRASDLEEYKPLIQWKHNRELGTFEVFDGMMLKDGYLYKKVSIDSLSLWDVNPSREEVQKFTSSSNEEPDHSDFLTQLYGVPKNKPTCKADKGGGKGEGTSESNEKDPFEVHNLVSFGKRDFGMVIGIEKGETFKVLHFRSGESAKTSFGRKDLNVVHLDKNFNALDNRSKTIHVNDMIKILDGPEKGRDGAVKQIYRGIVFVYNQNDTDGNAYFCARSQNTEKVKPTSSITSGKDSGVGPSGCEDMPSSPQSPLSPVKPWLTGEQNREFKQRDSGRFAVGQSLRFRIGPLKGYRCRVLAVRYSNVTVKLDSQQKVLTVKSDHLAEVNGNNLATSTSDNAGFDSSRPFGFLGSGGASNDWLPGSVQNDGANNESSAWPTLSSSGHSLPSGPSFAGASDSAAADDAPAWGSQPNTTNDSSWGASIRGDQVGASDAWGKNSGNVGTSSAWDRGKSVDSPKDGWSAWGQGTAKGGSSLEPQNDAGSSWGGQNDNLEDSSKSWDKGKRTTKNDESNWGDGADKKDQPGLWNKVENSSQAIGWGNEGLNVRKQWNAGPSDSSGWNRDNNGGEANEWKGVGRADDQVVADNNQASFGDQVGGSDVWGKSSGGDGSSSAWGRGKSAGADCTGTPNDGWSSWGHGTPKLGSSVEPHNDAGSSWGGQSKNLEDPKSAWDGGTGVNEDGKNEKGWSKGVPGANESSRNAEGLSTELSANPASVWGSGSSSGWGAKDKCFEDETPCWGGNNNSDSQPKDSGNAGVSPWKIAAGSWDNNNFSGGSKEWKNSSSGTESQSGGWGNGDGDWVKNQGGNNTSWSTSKTDTWGPSKNFEDNKGFGGRSGEFGGRRGRGWYCGGPRDQSGRGGGRSYGRGQSWNNRFSEDKPSWSSSYSGGNTDKGSTWGNSSGGWSNEKDGTDGKGSWGQSSSGWGKGKEGYDGNDSTIGRIIESSNTASDLGKDKGAGDSTWTASADSGWGNSSHGKRDQGSGGGGWGREGGNSSEGKTRGWGNSTGGWRNEKDGTDGKGSCGQSSSSWGKGNDGNDSTVGRIVGRGNTASDWGKDKGAGDSTWNASGDSCWGNSSQGKHDQGSGGGGWGKEGGGSASGGWGKDGVNSSEGKSRGWGNSSGGWSNEKDGTDAKGNWGQSSGGWGKGKDDSSVGTFIGSSNRASDWGKDNGAGNSDRNTSGDSGWGNSSHGKLDQGSGVGGWGKDGGNSFEGKTRGWGNASYGNNRQESGRGGWGKESGGSGGGGWGKESGGSGGGGWGKDSGGSGGDGGWGKDSCGSGGDGGWGKDEGGSCGGGGWGKDEGASAGVGSWGNSAGGKTSGWGKDKGGSAGGVSRWGSSSDGRASGGNGWDNSAHGKNDQGSGGWKQNEGGNTSGGRSGWGSSGSKEDHGCGNSWKTSSGGNTSGGRSGWGSSGAKEEHGGSQSDGWEKDKNKNVITTGSDLAVSTEKSVNQSGADGGGGWGKSSGERNVQNGQDGGGNGWGNKGANQSGTDGGGGWGKPSGKDTDQNGQDGGGNGLGDKGANQSGTDGGGGWGKPSGGDTDQNGGDNGWGHKGGCAGW